jgi:hypothetical protein
MRTDYSRYILTTSLILLISWAISCSGRPGGSKETSGKPAIPSSGDYSALIMKMLSPGENEEFKLGTPIKVTVAPETDEKSIDSVKIFFDGKTVTFLKSAPWEYSIPSGMNSYTGRKSVKAVAYSKSKIQTLTRF